MGGEITWQCQGGGQYIFTMVVYRDCNATTFTTTGVALRVWNHPTLTSIPMNFISQTDISPSCRVVAGGPSQITCGGGGSGAIERYLFQSNPITISGTPPTSGWAFTYDNFSRNPAIDNLVTPNLFGLTLRALMYPYFGSNTNPCYDSSPQFLDNPTGLICAGTTFKLNQHATDSDGDSLVFDFANALDQISSTTPMFNPPVSPIEIPYTSGYSYNSPTPGIVILPSNIPATINSQTGEIEFTSFTQGNFVVVVRVQSYRCGQLISEVFRETQIIITNCSGNNLPIITPPFGASFSTTVYAGQPVNFTITATDNDLLQDGSAQSVTLNATGTEFGAGFLSTSAGCDLAPCAVMNTTLPVTNTTTISRDFSWQTTCAHLPAVGCGQVGKLYSFVFKVSDDFCPAPGVSTATVSIRVLPPPAIGAPEIRCADVALNGDVTLTWSSPSDTYGTFDHYEIFNAGSGAMIASIPTIATNSFTHIGADAQNGIIKYTIKVVSGCNASLSDVSDTTQSMFINVVNTGSGLAVLTWNKLFSPVNHTTADAFYTVWREYPLGTWSAIGTTPYGIEKYIDTISICDDTLNYKVSVSDSIGCISYSSIRGEWFTDLTEPYVPIIAQVTVDTLTGATVINWLPDGSQDTQGYIILQNTSSGWIVVDTVNGILNTTYIPPGSNPFAASEEYGVAAFDSCWKGSPASPNTSPMSVPQHTIFLKSQLNICDSSVTLTWNAYTGWPNGVSTYDVYASENNLPYTLIASLAGGVTTYTHSNLNRGSVYEYVIRASALGYPFASLSNITQKTVKPTDIPAYTYLSAVTVNANQEIEIKFITDAAAKVREHILYKSDDYGSTFFPVASVAGGLASYSIFDYDVLTNSQSYYYKIVTIDSCGKPIKVSNVSRSIFLQVIANSVSLENELNWNPYINWDGGVLNYEIEMSLDKGTNFFSRGWAAANVLFYNDDVSTLTYTTGEFCYRIKANENFNSYGFAQVSYSNAACTVIDPLIYVPNAFTPGGNNPIFMPVISYIDYTDYRMDIYDRWGQIIFSTNDKSIGWDGTHNNKLSKEDVYVYRIQFITGDGQGKEKFGHVTLLDFK